MCYIPDAYDMWCEHDRECEERLARRPVCECCGGHIQTGRAFYYNNKWFCTDDECEKELKEIVWEDLKSEFMSDVEE